MRAVLLAEEKLYAATLVSLVAYQGLRVPEEVLALEVKHVRAKTLLVEQRNITGKIVAGQKVRGFTLGRSTGSSPQGATSPSTLSRWDFAVSHSCRAPTVIRGSCTTTRTGAGASGTQPSSGPRPTPPGRARKARARGP